jgi:hypothetical protein
MQDRFAAASAYNNSEKAGDAAQAAGLSRQSDADNDDDDDDDGGDGGGDGGGGDAPPDAATRLQPDPTQEAATRTPAQKMQDRFAAASAYKEKTADERWQPAAEPTQETATPTEPAAPAMAARPGATAAMQQSASDRFEQARAYDKLAPATTSTTTE